MAYILCSCFLLACKKQDGSAALPEETFDAKQAARPELDVFGKVGCWEQTITGKSSDGKTYRTESRMFVDWGLRGHHLLSETEIQSSGNFNFLRLRLRSGSTEAEIQPAEYSKHNLVIKHFDELAETNPYQCVWIQGGLIYGFSGAWDNQAKQLNWHLTYPLGNPNVKFKFYEKFPEKNRKVFSFEVLGNGKVISKGNMEARYLSEFQKEKAVSISPLPEIERLGREGIWHESQTIQYYDGVRKVKGQSRMRWARDGRALINEGVLYDEERPEYYLWVKTWDAAAKLYRYAYFFEDGPVHHYVGKWDPDSESIKWQSMYPEGVIEITESLKQPEKRSWKVMVKERKWVSQGSGESRFYE